MSEDLKHALRHVLCLTNPSAMQGARWERLDMSHALRHVQCLANPSALAGARWGATSEDTTPVSPKLARGRQVSQIYQTQVSTGLSAAKCLKSLANARV